MAAGPVVQKVVRYGVEVWENAYMDALRKKECLCLNCGNMKPGSSDHCPAAKKLYELCREENLAMAITRCPAWKPKP